MPTKLFHSWTTNPLRLTIGRLLLMVSIGLGGLFLARVGAAQTPSPDDYSVFVVIEEAPNHRFNVDLHCDHASCDAVSLQIRFQPIAAHVVILSSGEFWSGSQNPVHIVRERVDNQQGLIEFGYVTEDRGGEPLDGTGTLLQLAVIPLSDMAPEFEVVAAEVLSLDGEVVYLYTAEPLQNPIPIVEPSPTPSITMVVLHVESEAGAPGQITALPLGNAELSVLPVTSADGQAAFEVVLTAAITSQDEPAVILDAPAHMSWYAFRE